MVRNHSLMVSCLAYCHHINSPFFVSSLIIFSNGKREIPQMPLLLAMIWSEKFSSIYFLSGASENNISLILAAWLLFVGNNCHIFSYTFEKEK